MDVGIRELRDGLSRFLAEVRGGQTITVTDHGKPIAQIVPVSVPTALERLIAEEGETLEALQAAIEPTGREAASEAVEHRLEHMIMRKQEQVDYLLRAQRRP